MLILQAVNAKMGLFRNALSCEVLDAVLMSASQNVQKMRDEQFVQLLNAISDVNDSRASVSWLDALTSQESRDMPVVSDHFSALLESRVAYLTQRDMALVYDSLAKLEAVRRGVTEKVWRTLANNLTKKKDNEKDNSKYIAPPYSKRERVLSAGLTCTALVSMPEAIAGFDADTKQYPPKLGP